MVRFLLSLIPHGAIFLSLFALLYHQFVRNLVINNILTKYTYWYTIYAKDAYPALIRGSYTEAETNQKNLEIGI